jgi:DNA-binding CsgD family transcriptional regulator
VDVQLAAVAFGAGGEVRLHRPRVESRPAAPSERRIAELAVSGAQNREIAQALFVTTATVEFHLRNAYRKLGISGRPGLADALGYSSSNSCS